MVTSLDRKLFQTIFLKTYSGISMLSLNWYKGKLCGSVMTLTNVASSFAQFGPIFHALLLFSLAGDIDEFTEERSDKFKRDAIANSDKDTSTLTKHH